MGRLKKERPLVSKLSPDEIDSIKGCLGEVPLSLLVGMRLEGLSQAEIGRRCGVSERQISRRLEHWSLNRLEYFKKHRADILATVGEKIVDLIEEKVSISGVNLELKDLSGTFAKLYDRERLERGLSTTIRSIQELDEQEKALEQEELKLREELKSIGKLHPLK